MFTIGNYVVHNGHGVCEILDIVTSPDQTSSYYKLKSIYNNMTIMLPCDKASSFLRPLMPKKELMAVLNQSSNIDNIYIKDNKERKAYFQKLVVSMDILDTIRLLKMLYRLVEDKKLEKKTLGSFDSQFLQQAERKLFNELAISANISYLDAQNFIISAFKPQTQH